MSRVIRHVELYKDARYFAAFPSLTPVGGGDAKRWLLMFRRAPDHRWWTDDESLVPSHVDPHSGLIGIYLDTVDWAAADAPVNLSEPFVVPGPPQLAHQDPSAIAIDGRIVLASFSWRGMPQIVAEKIEENGGFVYGRSGFRYIPWGAWTSYSDDDGATWSAPKDLPEVPGSQVLIPNKRALHGGATRGTLARIEDTLYLATYACRASDEKHAALLWVSNDRGESWELRSTIAFDPSGETAFYEPALYVTPSSRLVCLMRTDRDDDQLAIAHSSDGGESWSDFAPTGIVGHPCAPLRLPDGRLLVTYGYRHEPFGIRYRIAGPEAKDLASAEEFILRGDGGGADLGYPWATLVDEHHVMIVYYFHNDDGIRSIHGSVVAI